MTKFYNFLYRVYQPKHIGNMGKADQFSPGVQKALQIIKRKMSVLINSPHPELCSLFFAEHLPGNDIGMVLAFGNYDFIAGLDEFTAERVANKVDRSGGAGSENNLGMRACADI